MTASLDHDLRDCIRRLWLQGIDYLSNNDYTYVGSPTSAWELWRQVIGMTWGTRVCVIIW